MANDPALVWMTALNENQQKSRQRHHQNFVWRDQAQIGPRCYQLPKDPNGPVVARSEDAQELPATSDDSAPRQDAFDLTKS